MKSIKHRITSVVKHLIRIYVWRKIPLFIRQPILDRIINRSIVRTSPHADAVAPIIIVGLLSQPSGLGVAARACYNALRKDRIEVYGIDVTSLFLHEPQESGFDYRDGSKLVGPGTLIVHVGGDRLNYVLNYLGQDVVQDKHVLAHWFWELETLPKNWNLAMPKIHGICANSNFVANAAAKISNNKPVYTLPYPMDYKSISVEKATTSLKEKFVVTTIFNMSSNFYRKNPNAVIHSFQKAFGDDNNVELVVKYSNSDSWPKGKQLLIDAVGDSQNIRLIDQVITEQELEQLYASTDVVISLHRSEGLGLILIEAMQRGIPVISTDWSATSEFINNDMGYPVPVKLIAVDDPQGNYRQKNLNWADPDIDKAAQILKQIRQNPAEAAQKCENAKRFLENTYSVTKYAHEISKILK